MSQKTHLFYPCFYHDRSPPLDLLVVSPLHNCEHSRTLLCNHSIEFLCSSSLFLLLSSLQYEGCNTLLGYTRHLYASQSCLELSSSLALPTQKRLKAPAQSQALVTTCSGVPITCRPVVAILSNTYQTGKQFEK